MVDYTYLAIISVVRFACPQPILSSLWIVNELMVGVMSLIGGILAHRAQSDCKLLISQDQMDAPQSGGSRFELLRGSL